MRGRREALEQQRSGTEFEYRWRIEAHGRNHSGGAAGHELQ